MVNYVDNMHANRRNEHTRLHSLSVEQGADDNSEGQSLIKNEGDYQTPVRRKGKVNLCFSVSAYFDSYLPQ